MTCIVGLETKEGVIIGGDSAASTFYDIHATRIRKVFRNDNFLVGVCGSVRMLQLLQYKLTVEKQKHEQLDLEYLATTFIDIVRECFKSGGYAKIEHGIEEGGQFLVGYKKKLYMIDSDFQVNSYIDGVIAIGSGQDYALGSLWSTKKLPPKKRVERALKAAAHFDNSVCKPFHYIRENEVL